MNPLLSIIIPCYNAEKTIKTAISSVLSQTYPNIELILFDDGSTDNTMSICKKYINKNVFFYHRENKGVARTRREAIDNIHGDFFTFLDADDRYANKNAIKEIMKALESSGADCLQYKSNSWFYGRLLVPSHCTGKTTIVKKKEFYEEHYTKLLGANYCGLLQRNCWNKIYSRKLIHDLRPTEEFPQMFMGDDAFLNLQLLSSVETICYFDKAFYNYRKGTGGTSRFNRNGIEDYAILKKKQLSEIDRLYIDDEKVHSVLVGSCHIETVYSALFWFSVAIKNGYSADDAIAHIRSFDYCKKAKDYYSDESHCITTPKNRMVINSYLSDNVKDWLLYAEQLEVEMNLFNRLKNKILN